MSSNSHPSELNAFRQYRQATSIFRKTSRSKNPGWYQDALELPFQLHIRTDGVNVLAFLHDHRENLWAPGPPLTEQQLLDPAVITAYATAALEHVRSAGGTSLGVVLHVADEFSLTEINPGLQDRDTLQSLRVQAIQDPAAILADSVQTDQSSWRLIPYPSQHSHSIATAVTISRRHDAALAALRALGESEDFPVITKALSSPLVALLGIQDNIARTPDHPATVILQYASFTVIAFFDRNWDLLLLRTQLHRGLQRPPNFRHTIATSLASLELDSPDFFIFALGHDVDRTLAQDLPAVFPGSHIQEILVPGTEVIPSWCAECLISTQAFEPVETIPGNTLRVLREEQWAIQDFLPATKEIAEIYPTKQEISLLRLLRIARFAAVFIALAVIGWMVYGLFQIVRTPEWAFEPTEAGAIKQRLIALNVEKQRIEHWETLLADRSKGWTVMETLTRIFPENSGVLIRDFEYAARPDSTPGQAKSGMVREWKISGMTRQEGLELLNTLNSREGLSARFNEIARATGDESFRTDIGTRNLIISIRTQENNAFRQGAPPPGAIVGGPPPVDTTYPFTFDLQVTQRFEATDPLAIPSAKAP